MITAIYEFGDKGIEKVIINGKSREPKKQGRFTDVYDEMTLRGFICRRSRESLVCRKPENDLDQLRIKLEDHDWYYSYSDDARVQKSGDLNLEKIKALIKLTGQEGMALYNELAPEMFKGCRL